jgi:hypothetical protein
VVCVILHHKVFNGNGASLGTTLGTGFHVNIRHFFLLVLPSKIILPEVQYHSLPAGNLDRISWPIGQDGTGEGRDVRHRSARWIDAHAGIRDSDQTHTASVIGTKTRCGVWHFASGADGESSLPINPAVTALTAPAAAQLAGAFLENDEPGSLRVAWPRTTIWLSAATNTTRAFQVTQAGEIVTFDSFEFAIHAMARDMPVSASANKSVAARLEIGTLPARSTLHR